jgi:hypothetical protein
MVQNKVTLFAEAKTEAVGWDNLSLSPGIAPGAFVKETTDLYLCWLLIWPQDVVDGDTGLVKSIPHSIVSHFRQNVKNV